MKLRIKSPSQWGLVLVIKDILEYRRFITVIKNESRNKKSNFNKYNLKYNAFYVIYTMVSLDQSDAVLDERMKRVRVLDILKPIHTYLDDQLGFAGFLSPEFSQFYDDKGTPTLTYAAMYRYVFEKLSLRWVIKWFFISIILLICWHYHTNFINYITSLI